MSIRLLGSESSLGKCFGFFLREDILFLYGEMLSYHVTVNGSCLSFLPLLPTQAINGTHIHCAESLEES